MGGDERVNLSVRKLYILYIFVCLHNMIALRVMVGMNYLIGCFSFHLLLVALFYFVITQLCKYNVFRNLMTSFIECILFKSIQARNLF